MLNPFKKLAAWLSLEDYEEASESAGMIVAARFSRGNVAIQNKRFVDKKAYNKLREDGERARARLFA